MIQKLKLHSLLLIKIGYIEAPVGIFGERLNSQFHVFQLIGSGVIPGGTRNNLAYVNDWISWPPDFDEIQKLAICDAQTSGGLLAALPPGDAPEALLALHRMGIPEAIIIGRVTGEGEGRISFATN